MVNDKAYSALEMERGMDISSEMCRKMLDLT